MMHLIISKKSNINLKSKTEKWHDLCRNQFQWPQNWFCRNLICSPFSTQALPLNRNCRNIEKQLVVDVLQDTCFKNFCKNTHSRVPSFFFNKVIGVAYNFIKKRLCNRCFPVNFPTFLRTSFQQNTPERLLVKKDS